LTLTHWAYRSFTTTPLYNHRNASWLALRAANSCACLQVVMPLQAKIDNY
jgi:hypothetical protein